MSTDLSPQARTVPVRSALAGVVAILVYCCGAILAPTYHLAFHHADHVHLGDSIVVRPHDDHDDHDDDDDHEHESVGQHVPEHEEEEGHHHEADAHNPADSRDREHGASSVWHFGAALSDHLDRVPAVSVSPSLVPTAVAPLAERPRAVSVPAPRLRGPPPGSSSNA